MATNFRKPVTLFVFFAALTFFISCNKEISKSTSASTDATAIAVAASATASTSATADTVYIMQRCDRGQTRTAIAEGDLPAAVTAYLTTTYAGYTFSKAFSITANSTTQAYVVVIYYNDKPVGILFDASVNFVKVLEQREKGDIDGRGWHEGGRFCDRDGMQRDTVALSSLPSSVLSYMTSNYAQDTLLKAFKSKNDSSYAVVSRNNGLFITVFDANGNFVRRVTLPSPHGDCTSIVESALPANTLSYLTTTYPGYVFEKAFSFSDNGTLQGYVVVINSNNTKYAVRFDASGNFVSVKTVW